MGLSRDKPFGKLLYLSLFLRKILVSHQPERKEKDCLNCGAVVAGRYCQNCGQENILPKQTTWGLITHFVYDIFHFDGKFFHTLNKLLFRPGFVAKEYVTGKRMRYLDPIRMYLFTSAVFFLVFFSLKNVSGDIFKMTGDSRLMTKLERLEYSSIVHQQLKTGTRDSTLQNQFDYLLDSTYRIKLSPPETAAADTSFLITLKGEPYRMSVSKNRRGEDELNMGSGWFGQKIKTKWKAYKQRFGDDEKALMADMAISFIHKFPYILFVSLPFFALILKLLYVRRKQFYYSDHAVFTLYHYIFTFIMLLLYFLLIYLYDWLQWDFFRWIATALFLSGGLYLLLAMKRFYGQRWLKTFGKFLLLNFLAFIVVLVLLVAFIFLSVFQL